MNKALVVFKHEFLTILRSKSFLLTLILIPLIGFIVLFVVGRLQENNQGPDLTEIIMPSQEIEAVGFVDNSGLIASIPPEMTLFTRFEDEAGAQNALENQQIGSYYVIPRDYLQTGQVEYYRPDFNPMGGSSQTGGLEWLLRVNLLADDPGLLARVQQPLQLTTQYQTDQVQRDPDSGLTFFLPYGITFLFYMVILGSASLMLSNVTNEKQNRVMEVLLTSITPIQMMTGKIVALGLIGLLQTVVWTTSGFFLLRMSGRTFALPEEFQLPPVILLWGVIFFILGYAIYASLMAGVGALVPNLRESSQATFMVIIPLVIPLVFVSLLIQRPNAPFSIGLSLFPLTAPVAMMTRLAAIQVPIWQLLLAVVLQILTAIVIVRSVAGMFRAQNLLSGSSFKFKVFFKSLFGRV